MVCPSFVPYATVRNATWSWSKNGYFFKDGDADSLADRIREMFESPERCKEMGKESERMIREKINMETVSERYLKAFQEILRLTHSCDSDN